MDTGRFIIAVTGMSFISGCVTGGYNPPDPSTIANVMPREYRTEIIGALRTALKDPTSVRDAGITQPFVSFRGAGERYIVCIRFNAKNSLGGYTGIKDHVATFGDGRLIGFGEAMTSQDCAGRQFEPFQEIQNLA